MGDSFDTYMHISNQRDIRANAMRMDTLQTTNELAQRTTFLERKYGVEIPSYYEYKQEHPIREARLNVASLAAWTAGGTAVGGLLLGTSRGKVLGAITGAAGGFLIGMMASEQQETINRTHLDSYGQFLDTKEMMLQMTPQRTVTDVNTQGITITPTGKAHYL